MNDKKTEKKKLTALLKKKSIPTVYTVHLVLFFAFFLAGILSANLRCADEAFWMGFQIESACLQYEAHDLSWTGFFVWALKHRLLLWLVLCTFSCFQIGGIVLAAFTGWAGLSLGFLLAILAGQFSLGSIPMAAALLLPQLPFYLIAWLLLIKNKVKRRADCIVKCLLLSVLFLTGSAAEYSLNPWFLQKIYAFVTLFS